MTGFLLPRPITAGDQFGEFNSGEPTLDDWLRRRALSNEKHGATRTFVSCLSTSDSLVVGYYSLAAGSVKRSATPGRVSRNMPDPVPVVVLARLAVDLRWQGQGLGRSLLVDALNRATVAGRSVGVRAVLVHAINPTAAAYYQKLGFVSTSLGELTLLATLPDLVATLQLR